jgi:nucleotide-binding universal stress UspA family protein
MAAWSFFVFFRSAAAHRADALVQEHAPERGGDPSPGGEPPLEFVDLPRFIERLSVDAGQADARDRLARTAGWYDARCSRSHGNHAGAITDPTYPVARRFLAALAGRVAVRERTRTLARRDAHVIHVIERSYESSAVASEAELAEVQPMLRDLVESIGANVVDAQHIETGPVHQRIVSIADTGTFDLIVMGTAGRTGRPRSLAGSVAESVVPRPDIPC